jgi:hypothetical protein
MLSEKTDNTSKTQVLGMDFKPPSQYHLAYNAHRLPKKNKSSKLFPLEGNELAALDDAVDVLLDLRKFHENA